MQKIEVGKAVELEVDRETDFGFFLTDGTDDVLLHNSEISEGDRVRNWTECYGVYLFR